MGLHFLHRHGGRRLRQYLEQPPLDTAPEELEAEGEPPKAQLDFEVPLDGWKPIAVQDAPPHPDELPRRFIDGGHLGQTVAWLQDAEGHPIPVRLSEIGGVCVRTHGRTLYREFAVVERVVSLVTEPFPPAEVAEFASALAESGIRLLPAQPPRVGTSERAVSFDFERMGEQPRVRTQHEMAVLEEQACCR